MTQFKTRFRFLLPLILSGCVIILAYVLQFKVFVVRKVNCSLDGGACPDNLISSLDRLYLGQPLFSPALSSLNQSLTQFLKVYHLKQAEVNYQGQLTADFTPKPPLLSLFNSETQSWISVAADGTFLDVLQAPIANTTVINFAPTYVTDPNFKTIELMSYLSALVGSLADVGIRLPAMKIYQNTVIAADLPNDFQVLFSAGSPLPRQVASLQLILAKATINESTPIIDVRFDKPVLRQVIPGQSSVILQHQ